MDEFLIQSLSISSSDEISDSEDSKLDPSVDILLSELESEFTDFNISSLQMTFHFFNFLISEINKNYVSKCKLNMNTS